MKSKIIIMTLVGLFLVIGNSKAYSQDKRSQNKSQVKKSNKKNTAKKAKVVRKVPHHAYRKLPHRGVLVNKLPAGAKVVGPGKSYYYHDGIFYQPSITGYIVVRAPIGIHVNVLPPSRVRIQRATAVYFYYYGTFYTEATEGGYIATSPPVGARVNALPDGYETRVIDGQEYYILDDTYYKEVVDDDGEYMYEVVGDY